MSVDRKTISIMLAALDIEQRELAARMGYDKVYVSNVLCGFTAPSDGFKSAFGQTIADLVLGASRTEVTRIPAAPLVEYLSRRADEASCRSQFFQDLGLSPNGWHRRRKFVSEAQLDQICCALGIHPSEIYGTDYEVAC